MEIKSYDFQAGDFKNWEIANPYHCLYILEGKKYMYIGETSNVKRRAKEHKQEVKEKRYQFHTMHIVTDHHANATIMRHYERLLTSLMEIEGRYIVVSESKYKYIFYDKKNEYELKFDKLWLLLEKKGLVREKEFDNLLTMEKFSQSPFKLLNEEQKKTLKAILNILNTKEDQPVDKNYQARPLKITGMAGTGKTVLAITLFDYLKRDIRFHTKKIAVVVANPSLREEIKFTLKCLNCAKNNVIAPIDVTRKKYDIIICDEAHKLRRNKNLLLYSKAFQKGNERLGLDNTHDELDWILMQAKTTILFYDENQIVSPSEIPKEVFKKKIETQERGYRPIELKKQMRVQAGRTYIKYIYDILYGKEPKRKKFNNYILQIVDSYQELNQIIKEKEKKYGLSRKASGYGFEYRNDNTSDSHTILIDHEKAKWNTCTKGWIRKEECKQEIGSIYTLCGIDLNYIGLIIGPELYYDTKEKKIKLKKEEFYDNTVKKQASEEEIYNHVLNAYGILLTRAIMGTYIYICDDNLKKYLKRFFSSERR